MYRSMLNKRLEKPVVTLPTDPYLLQLEQRLARTRAASACRAVSYKHCSSEFVMWFMTLKAAANDRGLLLDCTALDMWTAIAANVELVDPAADEDDGATRP